MNKLIITIITTILLTAAGTVFAQDNSGDPGKKGHRGQRGTQAMQVTEQLMRAFKRLDLNEEQKANIKAAMQNLKTEVHPIMLEVKAGHEQLKELIKAENYDEKAVAALADKEGNLAAERIILTGKALSKAFGYLTEEQRIQLDAMASERKKQHAGKREGRVSES